MESKSTNTDKQSINNQQGYQPYNQKKYRPYNQKMTQPKVKLNNNGGVVIIEKSCNNNQGRTEPAIILFKCITWCADGGGRQSIKDINTMDTATRELKEESCNLFRFDHTKLNSVPKYTSTNYTCYFIGIDHEIKSEYFDENLAILKKNEAPRDWYETCGLRKFYVSDIKKMNLSGDSLLYDVPDIYGNLCNIKAKTKICIRKWILDINNNAVDFFKPHENLNFMEGPDNFAYGTKCYQL